MIGELIDSLYPPLLSRLGDADLAALATAADINAVLRIYPEINAALTPLDPPICAEMDPPTPEEATAEQAYLERLITGGL